MPPSMVTRDRGLAECSSSTQAEIHLLGPWHSLNSDFHPDVLNRAKSSIGLQKVFSFLGRENHEYSQESGF